LLMLVSLLKYFRKLSHLLGAGHNFEVETLGHEQPHKLDFSDQTAWRDHFQVFGNSCCIGFLGHRHKHCSYAHRLLEDDLLDLR
jgi:hypothetical protein